MDDKQLTALYGELYPYAKHKVGEEIAFVSNSTGAQISDEIMWIIAPAEGRPMTYVMREPSPATGLPELVYPSEIIEE